MGKKVEEVTGLSKNGGLVDSGGAGKTNASPSAFPELDLEI